MMYRNIADDEFTENVATDIKHFVKDVTVGQGSCSSKSVLLFPPVNNYRRFLIHKICDETTDADLHHFSIGQGDERRTVVCFTKDLIRVPTEPTMGIDQYCLPSMPPARHEEDKKWKVMAAIDIYRPPAARRLSAQKARAANPEPEKPKSKPRRPDIQVYVPRAKRLSASGSDPAPSATPPLLGRKPSANVGLVAEAPTSKPNSEHPPGLALSPLRNDTAIPSQSSIKLTSATCDISVSRNKSLDDDHIELCHNVDNDSEQINKESTSLIQPISNPVPETIGSGSHIDSSFHMFPPNSSSVVCPEQGIEDLCSDLLEIKDKSSNTDNASLCFKPDHLDNIGINTEDMELMELDSDTTTSNLKHHFRPNDDEKPNDTSYGAEILVSYNRKKCEDTSRNHEEQNRKNRLILHGKVMSDVLVISDPEPVQDLTSLNSESPPKTLPKKKICMPKEIPAVPTNEEEEPSNLDISKLSAEDCTWDMMFDENGDCLHPHLMEELTSKVGKVAIKSPRSDYKAFSTRTEFQPNDEYSHVLELYNFSPEFKTQDLVNIFSPYKDKGFEIKWVDDTHALGVFSSSIVAADVLSTDHPFVKTRPLHEATAESRVKARRSSEFLRPYRARPETCPALARRLVTGALGVRLKTAKQEREAEKVLLNQAREKKKLEARQKDDAWEGILGGN